MPEPIVVNGIPATRTQEVYDFKEKSHKNPIFFFFRKSAQKLLDKKNTLFTHRIQLVISAVTIFMVFAYDCLHIYNLCIFWC